MDCLGLLLSLGVAQNLVGSALHSRVTARVGSHRHVVTEHEQTQDE